MRYILTATRWFIAVATTLHLKALVGTVKASMRVVDKHARASDAASIAVDQAISERIRVAAAEGVARKAYRALTSAAQAEANTLRRGFSVTA